ncbi:hypothetical protein ABZY06_11490 [Streptomyces sp. NPDC006540]|uniref:hypothetical protein n=1 Tax=Streptomyces sp. NPDC006540 TaxID=3155353 RepID=UPI0033AFD7A0
MAAGSRLTMSRGGKDCRSPLQRPFAVADGLLQVALPGCDHAERDPRLAVFAEPGPDGRFFIGAKKATPRRNHFGKLWRKACDQWP